MQEKLILDKVNAIRLYLNSIKSKNIEKESDPEKEFEVNLISRYEIIENNEKFLSIKVNSTLDIEPKILLDTELEHIIEYQLNEKIDKKEIDDNINELLRPIGPETSFIISFLSEKMINNYLILPPKIEIKNKF